MKEPRNGEPPRGSCRPHLLKEEASGRTLHQADVLRTRRWISFRGFRIDYVELRGYRCRFLPKFAIAGALGS